MLRGSRCVLVRSLATPPAWVGMRVPTVRRAPGESDAAAAVRAASELCDIDGATEPRALPLPPALIHAADGPVPVYALYARNAPPPGPLEDADATDDDDLYDWYTWRRALAALKGSPAAVAALRTLACSLAAAAAAGAVPRKWGGVFGDEWTAGFGGARARVAPLAAPPAISATAAAAAPPPTADALTALRSVGGAADGRRPSR